MECFEIIFYVDSDLKLRKTTLIVKQMQEHKRTDMLLVCMLIHLTDMLIPFCIF